MWDKVCGDLDVLVWGCITPSVKFRWKKQGDGDGGGSCGPGW